MREKSVSFLCTLLVLMACFCVSVFAERNGYCHQDYAEYYSDVSHCDRILRF